eukprot:2344811-Rhodomonas_salina.1
MPQARVLEPDACVKSVQEQRPGLEPAPSHAVSDPSLYESASPPPRPWPVCIDGREWPLPSPPLLTQPPTLESGDGNEGRIGWA